MLDKLPAWVRHLAIVVGAVFLGTVAETIIASGGVSSVNWAASLLSAVDTAAVAGASAALLLWLTPATRQYGVGSYPKADKGDIHDVFGDESNI